VKEGGPQRETKATSLCAFLWQKIILQAMVIIVIKRYRGEYPITVSLFVKGRVFGDASSDPPFSPRSLPIDGEIEDEAGIR